VAFAVAGLSLAAPSGSLAGSTDNGQDPPECPQPQTISSPVGGVLEDFAEVLAVVARIALL
jgi:hypothetical protein